MSGSRKTIALLLVILELLKGAASEIPTYGVQDMCGSSIELESPVFGLGSSAVIKPTKYNGPYQDNRDCSLVVKRPLPQFEMVVSVRTLDFRPDGLDTLKITYRDGFDRSETFRNNHFDRNRNYDPMDSKSYRSSDDVTFTFSTRIGLYNSTAAFEGFEIVVTVVQREPCVSNQFRCDSGLCIYEKLKCDGHNHCGDNSSYDSGNCSSSKGSSDELILRYSPHDRTVRTGQSVGIAIAAVFGVVMLVCCCFALRRWGCGEAPTYTYPGTGPNIYAINSSGPYRPPYYYQGGFATPGYSAFDSTYVGGVAAGGYSAFDSTYVGDSATGCYSASDSTYVGDSAAGGYSAFDSTYVGDSAAGGYSAFDSTYVGDSATGGYSAFDSTYVGDSAAGGYSASESTYVGDSAAGGYSAY